MTKLITKENLSKQFTKTELKRFAMITIGTLIFCFGTNLLIVPMGLNSGGVMGLSQIIRTVLVDYMNLPIPKNVEIAGIINFLLNLPLFILAVHSISKSFFVRTVYSIIMQAIAFTLIPIPAAPLLEDMLSTCVIGGIVVGTGIGMVFRASGSSGGTDILGFYFTKKYKNFSIGKLTIAFNAVIYLICAIMFNVQVAIYSVVYIAIFSMTLDKIHSQNINTMAVVFTKNADTIKKILNDLHRGATSWQGKGAYTQDDMQIFITVISKYEIRQIKQLVYEGDPNAFIIFSEGTGISGNFEKRL